MLATSWFAWQRLALCRCSWHRGFAGWRRAWHNQDDTQFLIGVAEQSGIAIENAKMYENVKMNYEKLMTSPSSTVK